MIKINIATAQQLLDLMPSSSYGAAPEVDLFLASVKQKLEDAMTQITRGEASSVNIQIKVEK